MRASRILPERARAARAARDPARTHPASLDVVEIDRHEDYDPATQPLRVATTRVIAAGSALWAVALVVTLVVPELRTGDRSWWPWSCVTGLALGAFGYVYVRRGRGNAAGA